MKKLFEKLKSVLKNNQQKSEGSNDFLKKYSDSLALKRYIPKWQQ